MYACIVGQRWSGSRREVRVLAVGAAAGCGAGRRPGPREMPPL